MVNLIRKCIFIKRASVFFLLYFFFSSKFKFKFWLKFLFAKRIVTWSRKESKQMMNSALNLSCGFIFLIKQFLLSLFFNLKNYLISVKFFIIFYYFYRQRSLYSMLFSKRQLHKKSSIGQFGLCISVVFILFIISKKEMRKNLPYYLILFICFFFLPTSLLLNCINASRKM